MRIRSVTIKKLFGTFDHEIVLKEASRITILHGLNGVGKTTILRMLDDLFNGGLLVLIATPFEELVVGFDDGSWLEVHRTPDAEKWVRTLSPNFAFSEQRLARTRRKHRINKPLLQLVFAKKTRQGQEIKKERADVAPPFWEHEDAMWLASRFGRGDVRAPVARRMAPFDDEVIIEPESWAETTWLKDMSPSLGGFARRIKLLRDLRKKVRVQYIHTERLISMSDDDSIPSRHYRTVLRYSEELVEKIKSTLATFAQRTQDLDRSFPLRLVQKGNIGTPTSDEISRRISELEEKRARLANAGLIGEEEQKDIPHFQVDDDKRAVLSVYVEDMEQKFAVFDDLLERIELFKRLVSERFQHKRVSVDREHGFRVLLDDGAELSPSDLSSGEQHELVLLYEMLFKVVKDSLVLVDEPELSLHVAWQLRFLEDLERVVQLSQFDVLLATHSPQIINDRWDLTVALEGPDAG